MIRWILCASRLALLSTPVTIFAGKGLAETSRLALAATNTVYEDFRYPITNPSPGVYLHPEFDAAKGTFPMGQVPVLTVTKGATTVEIPQSKAIERYIARETGLFGATSEQGAIVDAIGELIADVKSKYTAAKAEDSKLAEFFATALPQIVATLAKYIISGGGFCVGGRLSLADIQLYSLTKFYFSGDAKVKADAAFAASAEVTGAVARVAENAGIAAWEAGRTARGELF